MSPLQGSRILSGMQRSGPSAKKKADRLARPEIYDPPPASSDSQRRGSAIPKREWKTLPGAKPSGVIAAATALPEREKYAALCLRRDPFRRTLMSSSSAGGLPAPAPRSGLQPAV